MKKQFLIFGTAILFAIGSSTFIGCGSGHEENSENHEHVEGEEHVHATYACPMDCEDGKSYDEAGTCPVCKMDLEDVAE